MHAHITESCDFVTLPKQSVGILGTLHVIFAFEDLLSLDNGVIVADDVGGVGEDKQVYPLRCPLKHCQRSA